MLSISSDDIENKNHSDDDDFTSGRNKTRRNRKLLWNEIPLDFDENTMTSAKFVKHEVSLLFVHISIIALRSPV